MNAYANYLYLKFFAILFLWYFHVPQHEKDTNQFLHIQANEIFKWFLNQLN